MTVLSNEHRFASPAFPETPTLRRRMACFAYEGLVLFGVALIPGAAGALAFQLTGRTYAFQQGIGLQLLSFVVYGAYFTFFWSMRGQTLPMQTWRIRVVRADGSLLSRGQALVRYLACWIWIAPGFALAWINGWPVRQTLAAITAWIVLYALLARLQPQRQFWHDVLCGNRLEHHAPPPVGKRR